MVKWYIFRLGPDKNPWFNFFLKIYDNVHLYVYLSNVLTERFSIPYKNQTKEDTSF